MSPRSITLTSHVDGDKEPVQQRINLMHIVRWYWSPAEKTTTIWIEGNKYLEVTDEDGSVDAHLCKAFFDVTPGDLI